jgi:hypothetical protein
MAQADSVPSAIRSSITGANSKAFTNRRRADRRYFIGGSDARIIMGDDEAALIRLWREKRGEIGPEDLSDMSGSNSWAEFAGLFRSTRHAFLEHERSKTELKALMPEDAKEAIGHGIRAKRSKSGAISFDLLEVENNRAAL